jgi:hypothetical protein
MAEVNTGVYQANDIIQVQIMGKLYGDWNMIVLAFRSKQTAFFNEGPREHLQGLCTFFASNIVVHQVWSKFRHRRIIPQPVTEYLEYSWTGTTGAVNDHAMPAQVAAVWQIRTAVDAPAGRGRFYLPGVALSSWSNNSYTAGAHAAKDGLKAQIQDWFKFGGLSEHIELGVHSRQAGGNIYNAMHTIGKTTYPGVIRSRRPEIFGA